MITLGRLVKILQNVIGTGYPVVLQTPDGRTWEPSGMVTSTFFSTDSGPDLIRTVVQLVPATENKS